MDVLNDIEPQQHYQVDAMFKQSMLDLSIFLVLISTILILREIGMLAIYN